MKVPVQKFKEPGIIPIPRNPIDKLEIDIQGPYTKSKRGNCNIIIATDYLTRFIFAKVAKKVTSSTVIKFIENLMLEHGTPLIAQTNQGTIFTSSEFKQFLKNNKIGQQLSTPYHSQTQGQVERMNKTLNQRIRLSVNPNKSLDWDLFVKPSVFSINNTVKRITGTTPFKLMKGYNPRTPMDNHFFTYEESFDVHAERERARARIEDFQDRYVSEVLEKEKRTYTFKKGDFILVRNLAPDLKRGKKLAIQMKGPYLITSISNAVVKAISIKTKKEIRVNLDKIYKYKGHITAKMNRLKHDYLQLGDPKANRGDNKGEASDISSTLDNNQIETTNQPDQYNESSDDEYFGENWNEIIKHNKLDNTQRHLGYDLIWTTASNSNNDETNQGHIETRNRQQRGTSYEEMISNIDFSESIESSDNTLQEEITKHCSDKKRREKRSEKSKLKEKIQESYEIDDTESDDEYLPIDDNNLSDEEEFSLSDCKIKKRDQDSTKNISWPQDKSTLTTIVQEIKKKRPKPSFK